MRTYLECIPCFLKQSLEASKLAGVDKRTQKRVMDSVMNIIPHLTLNMTPPEIAGRVYDIVGKVIGERDFYKALKKKSNETALDMYVGITSMVNNAPNPLLAALRTAVAGNVIDYGIPQAFCIKKELEDCREKSFAFFDYGYFNEPTPRLKPGESVHYITIVQCQGIYAISAQKNY